MAQVPDALDVQRRVCILQNLVQERKKQIGRGLVQEARVGCVESPIRPLTINTSNKTYLTSTNQVVNACPWSRFDNVDNRGKCNEEFGGYQIDEKYDSDEEKDQMSYILENHCQKTKNKNGTWKCCKCMYNNNSLLADVRGKNINCDGSGMHSYHYYSVGDNKFDNDKEGGQFCLHLNDGKYLAFCCRNINTMQFDLDSIIGEYGLFELFGDKAHLFKLELIE